MVQYGWPNDLIMLREHELQVNDRSGQIQSAQLASPFFRIRYPLSEDLSVVRLKQ